MSFTRLVLIRIMSVAFAVLSSLHLGKVPMKLKLPAILVVSMTLIGCVPTVSRIWSVQPVSGHVYDAATGEPIAGARVYSQENPAVSVRTDAHGNFHVEAASQRRFHVRMPASYIAYRLWRVEHEDYSGAVGITQTHAPAYSEQRRAVAIPVFRELPVAPDNACPDGPYVLRLLKWADDGAVSPQEMSDLLDLSDLIKCGDFEYRVKLRAKRSEMAERYL